VDHYYAIPIELNVRGSYRDITQYIASLRTLPMVISLTSLTLTSARTMDTLSAANDSSIKIEARLSGKIYQHQQANSNR
jgi:Tfp pilus assembly protein PilO